LHKSAYARLDRQLFKYALGPMRVRNPASLRR